MITLALLLTTAVPAQDSPVEQVAPPPAPQQNAIIVTAQPLASTENVLKECIARSCPPDEDIAATLAHAENLFVTGEYQDARRILKQSTRRNRKFASEHPVPVANLMRASARISSHLGLTDASRFAILDMRDVLARAFPSDSLTVLAARMEVADVMASQARIELAERIYDDVARAGRRAGNSRLEAMAVLRKANMFVTLSQRYPVYRQRANETLAALAASDDPGHTPFAAVANILMLRMRVRDGDEGAMEELVAALPRQSHRTPPVLLHADPVDFGTPTEEFGMGGSNMRQMGTRNFEKNWIDLGFWIAPDGRVKDMEILRTSGVRDTAWHRIALKYVGSRRYAPLDLPPDDPGHYRLERLTFTAPLATVVGSRMPVRSNNPRIEILDLTVDTPPAHRDEAAASDAAP